MLLLFDFCDNELLHFSPVVLHQVLSELFLDFVEGGVFCVFHLFPNGDAVLVDDDEDLFGLGHLEADSLHDFSEDVAVYLVKGGPLPVAQGSEVALALDVLLKVAADVDVEEVYGDFEDLILVDFHHH